MRSGMLNYVTRGNVNPSGKQKMYYASTVNDLGGIKDISRIILSEFDMAIYYEEDGDTSVTPEPVLCNMDCIILLLTEETLQTNNNVVNRILPLALKNKIPLLPLGITSEVGPLVGKLCNLRGYPSLDVLFPNSTDDTKLPFRERLHIWMSKFMTDTLEHKRILDNFRTRLFISYRKKDRQILRKLLSDIYQKADYRESLIWFDEYLTAGEDYDIEIQNMIDSSNLFIFLLTENMLEPDNYAIREELSRAIENKLPIMVIETISGAYAIPDKLLNYEGKLVISAPCDSDNISAADFSGIGNLLYKTMPEPAFSSKREELEHIYLLGMAYYLGIGAIKDKEFGVQMIRLAADKGLIEAMDRMVAILVEEHGDYNAAIKYQKNIVNYYDLKAGKSRQISDLEVFLGQMQVLGDYYKYAGDLENHEDVFRTMITALESINNLTEQKKLLEHATTACMRLGDVADIKVHIERSPEIKSEYFDETIDWYIKGYEYALHYQKYEESLMSLRMIYTPLMRIADEKYDLTDIPLKEIIEEYLKILKLIQDADAKYPCSDTRADLCACHKTLMELYHTVEMPPESLDNGQKMLDLARQGYLEGLNIDRLKTYTEALESFSKLQYEYGQTKDALYNLIKASKARSKYMEYPVKDSKTAELLFIDYISIVDLCIEEGRIEDARGALESAKVIAIENGMEDRPDVRNAIISRSDI